MPATNTQVQTIALAEFSTSGGVYALDALREEIRLGVTPNLISHEQAPGWTDVLLHLSVVLPPDEIAAFDAIVAAHTGDGLPSFSSEQDLDTGSVALGGTCVFTLVDTGFTATPNDSSSFAARSPGTCVCLCASAPGGDTVTFDLLVDGAVSAVIEDAALTDDFQVFFFPANAFEAGQNLALRVTGVKLAGRVRATVRWRFDR